MTPASESLVALTKIMKRIAASPFPEARISPGYTVTTNGGRRNRHGRQNFREFFEERNGAEVSRFASRSPEDRHRTFIEAN
jgi:hypothetical protein